MSDLIRRAHARYPCELPVEIYQGAASGYRLGNGILLDISLAGAFLRTEQDLKPATSYRLKFESPDGLLEIPCRVARVGPRNAPEMPKARHYGLTFNPSVDQERQLLRCVEQARRSPPVHESPFDRAMRDYWK
ncbi:MAG: PilZ domain-containing protein [Elusimicrobia bacterium]|nr:PilZ domain-containing protein [Elusimicrobiota bacterium]